MAGTKIAVVLAGAVAKGAFEAGALAVLASRNVQIVRIVGSSSGALNGTVLARGVCAGSLPEAVSTLVGLWEGEASLGHVFNIDWKDLFERRGIADPSKLLRLLASNVKPCVNPRAVGLRLVAAALDGARGDIGGAPATTYEHVCRFDENDFGSPDRLGQVFRAAVASASFPGAFAPYDSNDGAGPCVDGGTVNNTPIKYAVEGGGIDAVVVIAPTVQVFAPASRLHGFDLLGHLTDMLINERLYRDLGEAEDVNDGLTKLEELKLPSATLEAVKAAIGWTGKTRLELVAIRPEVPLPGNAFSGFTNARLRKSYVSIGRERAAAVLGDRWKA